MNVCVKYETHCYTPVLLGFSTSCRASCAKAVTLAQMKEIKESSHLPINVTTGKEPPSFKSDIFSYGRLLQDLTVKLKHDTVVKNRLKSFSEQCLSWICEIDKNLMQQTNDCLQNLTNADVLV